MPGQRSHQQENRHWCAEVDDTSERWCQWKSNTPSSCYNGNRWSTFLSPSLIQSSQCYERVIRIGAQWKGEEDLRELSHNLVSLITVPVEQKKREPMIDHVALIYMCVCRKRMLLRRATNRSESVEQALALWTLA
jgi:hypothetical protein